MPSEYDGFKLLWTSTVIFNCRATSEGGQYDSDAQTRLDTLQLAKKLGSEYVEYDLKVIIICIVLLSFLECFEVAFM